MTFCLITAIGSQNLPKANKTKIATIIVTFLTIIVNTILYDFIYKIMGIPYF